MNSTEHNQTSQQSFWKIFLLALFLGIFGVHRFAVGKVKSGLLQLITFGGLGIWAFIDDVTILLGKFTDSKGLAIPNTNPKASWATFGLAMIIGLANNSSDKKSPTASPAAAVPAPQVEREKPNSAGANAAEAKALAEWLAGGRWNCVEATEGLMKGSTLEFGTNSVTVKHGGETLIARGYKVVTARKSYQSGVKLSADLMFDDVPETLLQLPTENGFDIAALTWNKGEVTLKIVRRAKSETEEKPPEPTPSVKSASQLIREGVKSRHGDSARFRQDKFGMGIYNVWVTAPTVDKRFPGGVDTLVYEVTIDEKAGLVKSWRRTVSQ